MAGTNHMNLFAAIKTLFNPSAYPSVRVRRSIYLHKVRARLEMVVNYAEQLQFALTYNPYQWPTPELERILRDYDIPATEEAPADYVIRDASWRQFGGPYSGNIGEALKVFEDKTVDLYTPDIFKAPSEVDETEDMKIYGITNDPLVPFYPVSRLQREALIASIYNLQIVGEASHIRVFVPTVPYTFEMIAQMEERHEETAQFFEAIDWERVEFVLQSSVWREVVSAEDY